MSQRKTERWHRKLAELTATYAGHPLLAELEALFGNYDKLEQRLGKVASISDKMQSEMIRLNDALRAGEARYRMLTENMADVVWTLDTGTLRFTYVSPSIQKLSGHTPDEIMAAPLDALLAPQHRQAYCALIAQRAASLRNGNLGDDNAFIDELEQVRKGGGRVWTEVVTRYAFSRGKLSGLDCSSAGCNAMLSAQIAPRGDSHASNNAGSAPAGGDQTGQLPPRKAYILNPQSGQVELHGVTRDISERRLIQAQLYTTMQDLERAEAEQRQLLSVASHEFRTPAAMIKASLDSLAFLKERILPEVAQRLENIGQASLRLNKLANNLISHDRLQELALKPKKQAIELTQLVRDVVGKYPADSTLQTRLPEHPVILDADATLLGIAIHNLIDNALRYHAACAAPIHISLEESRSATGHWVELRVADQGPGVSDGEKEKIFQRFYSTKGGQSDGLGLSIVHSVARAHGGIAFVFDNTPQGAVFVIKLPGNCDGVNFSP